MKLYSLDDIKKLNNGTSIEYDDTNEEESNSYSILEFDSAKTRILKYVVYKKRSENEIRRKFEKTYSEDIIDDVIENLKENGYIDDLNYIDRTINEFIALKNLSLKEVRYKLLSKGIKNNDIDNYFQTNYDKLLDYEKQSAENLVNKKKYTMEEKDIRLYLLKKGYKEESIKEAL